MRADLFSLVVSRGIASLLQAVTLVALARFTSVQQFGGITALTGVALVIYAAGDLGASQFVVKARSLHAIGDVRAALSLNTLSSVVLAAPFVVSVWALVLGGLMSKVALSVLVIAFGIEKNADCQIGILIADQRRWAPGLNVLARRLIGLSLLIALHMFGVESVLAYSVGYLAGAACSQITVRTYLAGAGLGGSMQLRPALGVLKRTWPFFVDFVSGQLRTLDATIVLSISGGHQAGLYAAASRLTAPVLLIPGALGSLLMPRAVRGTGRHLRRIAVRLWAPTIAGVVVAFLMTPVAGSIMSLLFGSAYASAGSVFVWSLAGTFFFALAAPLSTLLQGRERQREAGWIALATTAAGLCGASVGAAVEGAELAAACLGAAFLARCLLLTIVLVRETREIDGVAAGSR